MIEIENTLVSFDIIEKKFACNLNHCLGICCVQGDSGAPIDESEKEEIEKCLPQVFSQLLPEAQMQIKNTGVAVIDCEGDLVTNTLPGKGACVFAVYNQQDIVTCAFEKSWFQGKITFRKPISCHLYPVRITRYKYYDAVNFHSWEICNNALSNGITERIPLYVFLKDAFIRKYGNDWYNQLVYAAENISIGKQRSK